MLTLDEIGTAKLNPAVVREAYAQAERRLSDLLDTKKVFEQKAFTLFNAYVAVALALMGVAGTMYKTGAIASQIWPFAVVGLVFVVGAALFVGALLDKDYGGLGSGPEMWLNRGTIDGGDEALSVMLAYITYYHKERINVSEKSNVEKGKLIRNGIWIGLSGPVFLIALLIIA